MDVTIVDNDIDRQEMRKVMDAYADMLNGDLSKEEWNNTDKYPRKQWLDFDGDEKALPFTVVDNREGECFVEGFSTLDGAILYICDCHMTCEDQEDWDYYGSVRDHGGVDEKGDDNEYVIKCPIAICGASFVFGYVKKIVEKGRTDDVFTENIDEALKFGSRIRAVKAAKNIFPGFFDGIKNVVLVSDEMKYKTCI
jgi:hypothetical protein